MMMSSSKKSLELQLTMVGWLLCVSLLSSNHSLDDDVEADAETDAAAGGEESERELFTSR